MQEYIEDLSFPLFIAKFVGVEELFENKIFDELVSTLQGLFKIYLKTNEKKEKINFNQIDAFFELEKEVAK